MPKPHHNTDRPTVSGPFTWEAAEGYTDLVYEKGTAGTDTAGIARLTMKGTDCSVSPPWLRKGSSRAARSWRLSDVPSVIVSAETSTMSPIRSAGALPRPGRRRGAARTPD